MVRPAPRSNSRLSMSGKPSGGSRASDEDTKTAVKVGEYFKLVVPQHQSWWTPGALLTYGCPFFAYHCLDFSSGSRI